MKTKIIDRIREKDDYILHNGVQNEAIELAEKKIGVLFSEEYKEYLRDCGEASFAGHEFTGIYGQDRLDVVCLTIEERQRYSIDMGDVYVIECLNIDDLVIWQNTDGEVFISQPTITKQKIFDSWSDYIDSI